MTDRSPDGSALVGARSRRLSLPRVATPHLAWNIVRWGVSQGATFAVNIASARALGRETFGAFGILQTSLQTFTQAFVMMGAEGQPARSTLFYALYLFTTAFYDLRMGYASAMAWILFIIIVVLTVFATKWFEKRVHYGR